MTYETFKKIEESNQKDHRQGYGTKSDREMIDDLNKKLRRNRVTVGCSPEFSQLKITI